MAGGIEYQGVSGSVKWALNEEGVMLFEPVKGNKGTLACKRDSIHNWFAHWASIKKVEAVGKIYLPKDSSFMFSGCYSLINFDSSHFDTSRVVDMGNIFSDCQRLAALDLSGFDTSNVKNMKSMFRGCLKLTTLDVSSFDTSNVTDMGFIFSGCELLTNFDLSGFNTSNVTSMRGMFEDCNKITSLNLSNFDTHKVTNMNDMFSNCSALVELDLSSFDTSKVAAMGSMFYNCQKLLELDLSNFNTSSVKNMPRMFRCCTNLEKLDISNFDTSNVTEMSYMFSHCCGLKKIDTSGFKIGDMTTFDEIFKGCDSLIELDLTNFEQLKNRFYDKSGLSLAPRHYIVSEKIEAIANKIAPFAPFFLGTFGFYLKTIIKIFNALKITNGLDFSELVQIADECKYWENNFVLYKAMELSQSDPEAQTIHKIIEVFKARGVFELGLSALFVEEIVGELKSRGVDSDIDACLSGVPLEDILA